MILLKKSNKDYKIINKIIIISIFIIKLNGYFKRRIRFF